MSVVTEHLEQQGSAFEVLPHRQTYTSADEAYQQVRVLTRHSVVERNPGYDD
jgi:hypothetical protein